MEYDVVIADRNKKLAIEVNALIKEGWRPLGAAQMAGWGSRGKLRYCQTMVKDDDDEAKSTDMAKLTDMVKLENEILAAAKVNHDEAMTRMTEQIEAMIRHEKAND